MNNMRLRIWDKPSHHMMYNIYQCPIFENNKIINYILVSSNSTNRFGLVYANNTSCIMHCTDLSDKHKTLIYEGDIVKTKQYMGYIQWDKRRESFIIKRCNEFIDYLSIESSIKLRVIGNIFQSPNLLLMEHKYDLILV